MIESVMLVVFGFCAATLLGLIVLPFVTGRAARLAAERLEDTLPLSINEIAAERDGLRAAAAVAQRRLEQRTGTAEATLAARDTELGRRTSELAALQERHDNELTAKAALAADLARIETRCAGVEVQRDSLKRSVNEAEASIRALEGESRTLATRRDALEAVAEERRAAIAGLETRCAGLEMRREDLEADLQRNRGEQDKLRTALTDMTRDRDLSRTEVQLVATQRAILQDDVAEANRRAEMHRVRFEAKTEALARAEQLLMTEKADHIAVGTALDELRRRFQLLEARLIENGGYTAETSSGFALDTLRAEVVGVADQALQTLRPLPRAATGAAEPEDRDAATTRDPVVP